MRQGKQPAKISARSVFEVDRSRLGIGQFSRPLLDAECRKFWKAWEMAALPGLEDFQVDQKRVSFVAPPEKEPPGRIVRLRVGLMYYAKFLSSRHVSRTRWSRTVMYRLRMPSAIRRQPQSTGRNRRE